MGVSSGPAIVRPRRRLGRTDAGLSRCRTAALPAPPAHSLCLCHEQGVHARDRHATTTRTTARCRRCPRAARTTSRPQGYARLRAELLQLIDDERPKVVEVVHWAASNGDRSENGDYLYGKKRLREIDRRIRFLTKRLEIAEVTDPRVHHGSDQVFFGATVTYADEDTGEERTVTILGIDEADSAQGQVSWISPIARALLKAREGDVVKLVTPAGAQEIEVLEVQLPARRAVGAQPTAVPGAHALRAHHRRRALEVAQHRVQVRAVAHRDHEAQVGGVLRALVVHVHVGDVGLGAGQRRGDAGQHALAVGHRDQHAGLEGAHRLVGPFDADEALAVLVLQALGHARSRRCAPPGLRRGPGSRRWRRPARAGSSWRTAPRRSRCRPASRRPATRSRAR